MIQLQVSIVNFLMILLKVMQMKTSLFVELIMVLAFFYLNVQVSLKKDEIVA